MNPAPMHKGTARYHGGGWFFGLNCESHQATIKIPAMKRTYARAAQRGSARATKSSRTDRTRVGSVHFRKVFGTSQPMPVIRLAGLDFQCVRRLSALASRPA